MFNERDPAKLYPHDYLMKYTILPLIPSFVRPNAVTILRFVLTPIVLWLLFVGNYAWGVPLFIFTSFTDAIDGSLARVRGQISPWGTFYDPVADKLLISTVALLIVAKHINVIFALIIVAVELLIVLGGLIRRKHGSIVSANVFGKTKMVLQVVGVSFLLFAVWFGFDLFIPASIGTLSLALVFAVISLFTYGL